MGEKGVRVRQGDALCLHMSAAMAWNFREELLERWESAVPCVQVFTNSVLQQAMRSAVPSVQVFTLFVINYKLWLRIKWLLASQCLGFGTTPACSMFYVFQAFKVTWS